MRSESATHGLHAMLSRLHQLLLTALCTGALLHAAASGAQNVAREDDAAQAAAVQISATKRDVLVVDGDGDSNVDPGDTLRYDIVIDNAAAGATTATGVTLTDTPDAETTLVPNSINLSPLALDDGPYAAIGNVTLNVAPGGGISANDREFAGAGYNPACQAFSITQINGTNYTVGTPRTLTSGAVLTLQSDGTIAFTSAPGANSGSDSFAYTITDACGLSNTGTASFNIAQRVWFADSADLSGPFQGTEANPFNALTALNGAGGSGDADAVDDIVYLVDNATDYIGNFVMEPGQRLVGSGAALVVGTTTVRPGGTAPVLTGSIQLASAGIANPNVSIEGLQILPTGGSVHTGSDPQDSAQKASSPAIQSNVARATDVRILGAGRYPAMDGNSGRGPCGPTITIVDGAPGPNQIQASMITAQLATQNVTIQSCSNIVFENTVEITNDTEPGAGTLFSGFDLRFELLDGSGGSIRTPDNTFHGLMRIGDGGPGGSGTLSYFANNGSIDLVDDVTGAGHNLFSPGADVQFIASGNIKLGYVDTVGSGSLQIISIGGSVSTDAGGSLRSPLLDVRAAGNITNLAGNAVQGNTFGGTLMLRSTGPDAVVRYNDENTPTLVDLRLNIVSSGFGNSNIRGNSGAVTLLSFDLGRIFANSPTTNLTFQNTGSGILQLDSVTANKITMQSAGTLVLNGFGNSLGGFGNGTTLTAREFFYSGGTYISNDKIVLTATAGGFDMFAAGTLSAPRVELNAVGAIGNSTIPVATATSLLRINAAAPGGGNIYVDNSSGGGPASLEAARTTSGNIRIRSN